jgi:hypothetical protein
VVAVGPDGLVYVPREGGVKVFSPEGSLVRFLGEGADLVIVSDIEVDGAGNVYATSRANRFSRDDTVVRFDKSGNVTARLVPLPGKPGQVTIGLGGIAVAPDGSIYVITDRPRADLLVHLDRAGRRLPAPRLDIATRGGSFTDVEFANGRLYFTGAFSFGRTAAETWGLLALSPAGLVVDVVLGSGGGVAVRKDDVYVSGLDTGRRTPAYAGGGRFSIGRLQSIVVTPTSGTLGTIACPAEGGGISTTSGLGTPVLAIGAGQSSSCQAFFVNLGSPCDPRSTVAGTPQQVYIGSKKVTGGPTRNGILFHTRKGGRLETSVWIQADELSSGSVVVEWTCVDKKTNAIETGWELKGDIVLYDPSGSVLDSKTGQSVDAASVRLQFSPRRRRGFGTPTRSAFSPQVNPQTTARDGQFGWDVAEGFWRLRITAFGYRPFTSPTYKVPPEVTGLRLKLRPDPGQQARLVDPYRGRVGGLGVGSAMAGAKAYPGLRVEARGGRVRVIAVRAKRFRTARGIALGSRGDALLRAYPPGRRRVGALRTVGTYRVGRATFTVKGSRVVAIVLGRS